MDKLNIMEKIYNILQNLENYLNFQKALGVREIINFQEEKKIWPAKRG